MTTGDLHSSAAGSAASPVTPSPTQSTRSAPALPGGPLPLGATIRDGGTNFAVAAGTADGILLCLFDASGAESQITLLDYDAGVWHAFLPGVGAGQAYGYRAYGRHDPGSGLRFSPAKLLLDPYAKAIAGAVSFGPEVLGYAQENPDAPSTLDSCEHVPRSFVADETFTWSDGAHPRRRYADTVIYEVHVKGFTMRHPGVPPELRGTYAGLGHKAAIAHLLDLGVTAVELLPVHESVPEAFLLERGLTNYWGYNTIGYFAPIRGTQLPCGPAGPGARSVSSKQWSTPCTAPGSRSCST
jgi:isoamylase